ncbi:WXG100 family type VII secretion target [Streptomyces sp. NPDC097640]|uniref:WXG100 family type VII secretion target n=1 Tax=Streptomyces sp. NPDC097640 TaxID=3157229 RepID=UPI00331869FB
MAGAEDLKVHYGSVEQTANDIDSGAKVVRKQMDDLLAAVKRVTDGWEGEAHQMMQSAEKQWNARATHIEATLKQVAAKIRDGSMAYQATDKKASTLFDISY